jgi:hypothetical protein
MKRFGKGGLTIGSHAPGLIMDARVKPGHDNWRGGIRTAGKVLERLIAISTQQDLSRTRF